MHLVGSRGASSLQRLFGGALVASLFLCAPALFAYRFEFITTVSGDRLPGSEVCFYKGLSFQDPAAMYLTSDDVRCFPADKLIDVPLGIWVFYARHADGWVSAHGSAIRRTQEPLADQGYRTVKVELERAAAVTFDAPPGDHDRFVAYVPISGDPHHAPAAFPLPRGERIITVPAGRPFLVLRVRDGQPIGAGPLTALEPGQTIRGEDLVPSSSQRDLVGWLRISDESIEEPLEQTSAPVMTLRSSEGATLQPLYHIDGSTSAHSSFFVFQRIPTGLVSVELSGESWKTATKVVKVDEESPGSFLREPMEARLRQRMVISWTFPPPLSRFAGYPKTCSEKELVKPGEYTVQLLTCPLWDGVTDPKSLDLSLCSVRRESIIPSDATKSVAFELTQPERHIAALYAGGLRLGVASAVSQRDCETSVPLQLLGTAMFGRVTDAHEPIQALLRFATGSAVTDETGYYEVLLRGDPGLDVIEVAPCDGSATFDHIPSRPVSEGGPYDINLPGNRVTITVFNARDKTPVPGAFVGRGLFETKEDAESAELDGDMSVDDSGQVLLRRFQPGYFLRVCASASGFASPSCAQPIELFSDTVQDVSIQLREQKVRSGRLHADGPIVAGTLFRTMRNGRIVERIPLKEDGSFEFTGVDFAEYLVIASANLPLFLVSHPNLEAQDSLDLSVPADPVREFTVEVAKDAAIRSGFFTLAIGEAVVPISAFSAHITRRGLSTYIEDGGPARVVDIVAGAPIRVCAALGDFSSVSAVEELFLLPQYAPFLRYRVVPGTGRVYFEPE